jgi:phenylacetate-CoA ligase
MMQWWGLGLGTQIGCVFRLRFASKLRILINGLIWFPTKRLFLDASSFSPEDVKVFITKFIKHKAKIIQGYNGALSQVAEYVIANNINITGVKAVWGTSSPLTYTIRKNFEKAFNADVYDQYGSGEVYWVATECEKHEGLHIHQDMRHVDIVDETGRNLPNGNMGEMLVTDLDNELFPIIRYKNGDMSIIKVESCSCGRPYDLLEKISGRVSDLIKLPKGGFISGDYFTTIFDDYPDLINGFQIHQTKDYKININVAILNDNLETQNSLDTIEKVVIEKTKNEVEVSINKLAKIDNSIGGKNRFVICDIK